MSIGAVATTGKAARLLTYGWKCDGGHRWSRTMTREQFVDETHTCHKCGAAGRRDIPIAGGVVKVARELKYPYVNMQLPFKYRRDGSGNVIETIKPVIENAQQERDYAAGGWNGEQWRINQL